jgi:hypothetical protein
LRKGIHENPRMQNFYSKYGEHSLEWNVLEFCEKDQLLIREQFYLDTTKPWFNIHKIAKSPLGRVVTEETKRKLSNALTGRKFSLEHRAAIGRASKGRKSATKGKPLSEKHKDYLRKIMTGRKLSEEHKEKIRQGLIERGKKHPSPLKGTKISQEHKEKCREASRGRKHTEEAKNKIRQTHLGKKLSDDQKKAIGIARRGKNAKLNEGLVKEIKSKLQTRGERSILSIAKEYDISYTTVHMIGSGKRWGYVCS